MSTLVQGQPFDDVEGAMRSLLRAAEIVAGKPALEQKGKESDEVVAEKPALGKQGRKGDQEGQTDAEDAD